MTRAGRPLRFLAFVLGGWTFVRLLMLGEVSGLLPTTLSAPVEVVAPLLVAVRAVASRMPATPAQSAARGVFEVTPSTGSVPEATSQPADGAEAQVRRYGVYAPAVAVPVIERPAMLPERAAGPPLLTGSAWLVARGNGSAGSEAPQLGGGQAGMRVVLALDRKRRLAAAARVTTPLEGRGQEAAVGVEWQPTALPVRLVAEHRVAIDSRGGGPTVAVVGGSGPAPLAGGFQLESYGAAGMVGRDGLKFFAEGSVRAMRPVATVGGSTVAVGGGAWAATQPGADRADVGPSIELSVPVGARRLRAILDWRQRIGGEARPGSGPALTLATDF